MRIGTGLIVRKFTKQQTAEIRKTGHPNDTNVVVETGWVRHKRGGLTPRRQLIPVQVVFFA